MFAYSRVRITTCKWMQQQAFSAKTNTRGSRTKALSPQEQKFKVLLTALKKYYEKEGHFIIANTFQVPSMQLPTSSMSHQQKLDLLYWPKETRGMRLGKSIQHVIVKVAKGNSALTQPQVTDLLDIGFPLHQWKEYVWTTATLPALRTFKELEGHLFVPQKFIVPHGDERWPRAAWNFNLGGQVTQLRQRKDNDLSQEEYEVLEGMGFVWNVSDAKWNDYFMPGLRQYQQLHGHANVPMSFQIPEEAPWPKQLQGFHLGRFVYMVRAGNYSSHAQEAAEELDALGFTFNVSQHTWNNKILPLLRQFSERFQHCDVPQDFVVPATNDWPKIFHGVALGHIVANIRQGKYSEQATRDKERLRQLGFIWNSKQRMQDTIEQIVIPALETYEQIKGDTLIPIDFVVPNTPEWAPKLQGFKIGRWMSRIRAGDMELSSATRDKLAAAGFWWNYNDVRFHDIILPAFEAYAKRNGSCESMNTKFHVPEDSEYPEKAWGVNLGGAMWHIRNGDCYVRDKDKLALLKKLGVIQTVSPSPIVE